MKRMISLLLVLVLAMGLVSVSVGAYSVDGDVELLDSAYDEDGHNVTNEYDMSISSGRVTGDVPAGETFYVQIADPAVLGSYDISVDELTDSDNFSFKLDKDENGRLIDSVKLVNKRLGSRSRADYIAIKLKNTTMTDEEKITFDVYFHAKHTESGQWYSGENFNVRFELWVSNHEEDGEDATIGTGEGVVFNPVSNERNTITWGDDEDIACLEFMADDDADKFYARLSTKVIESVYDDYGDPADAELFFRNFVGSPSIDSTSRAVLTLYNPWSSEYDNYRGRWDDVDPRDVYIYLLDRDGYLEDITDLFTYVDEYETEAGIDGWRARVRTLGCYVLSDKPLDVEEWVDDDGVADIEKLPPEQSEQDPPVLPPQKPNEAPPSTGSHDYVSLAVLLVALSAGAIIGLKHRK